MPRAVLFGLSAVFLSLVLAACDGGSSEPLAAATPSPTAPTAASPTAPADDVSGNEDGLYAPQVVKKLTPSVVHVLSEAATLDVFGQVTPTRGVGTGFIIDEEGHIVTNNHVVVRPDTCDEPARSITVTLSDGRQFRARIVGRDAPTDLAVLQIDADGLAPAKLGSSSAMQVGDGVVAIGNALDLPGGPTVTMGVVSAKDRLIVEDQCGVTIPGAIQTDAAINPGNSGGPLVDKRGEVVGITTAIIGGAEGIGFAISIDSAKPVIDELIAKGRVERGFMGVSIVEITPRLAESFDLAVERGIGLGSVEAGGPADEAGLRPGDIIVEMAGQEIRNSGDLFKALGEHRAGETVTVGFYRDGSLRTAEITLG